MIRWTCAHVVKREGDSAMDTRLEQVSVIERYSGEFTATIRITVGWAHGTQVDFAGTGRTRDEALTNLMSNLLGSASLIAEYSETVKEFRDLDKG